MTGQKGDKGIVWWNNMNHLAGWGLKEILELFQNYAWVLNNVVYFTIANITKIYTENMLKSIDFSHIVYLFF